MPRKNHIQPIKRRPFLKPAKRRYTSRAEANEVADRQMTLHMGLQLYIYQDTDGGWYLTRQKPRTVK